jgi:hypothetical protein
MSKNKSLKVSQKQVSKNQILQRKWQIIYVKSLEVKILFFSHKTDWQVELTRPNHFLP